MKPLIDLLEEALSSGVCPMCHQGHQKHCTCLHSSFALYSELLKLNNEPDEMLTLWADCPSNMKLDYKPTAGTICDSYTILRFTNGTTQVKVADHGPLRARNRLPKSRTVGKQVTFKCPRTIPKVSTYHPYP